MYVGMSGSNVQIFAGGWGVCVGGGLSRRLMNISIATEMVKKLENEVRNLAIIFY
jgi:hypothetical protein